MTGAAGLTLLVDAPDRDAVPQISGLLEEKLPGSYRGLPVRFPVTWDRLACAQDRSRDSDWLCR